MIRDELISLAKSIAKASKLDPAIVCGIIQRESSFDPGVAPRFEPAYKVRYIDHMDLPDDEKLGRSTSWGMMQLMGESARECGYDKLLVDLRTPEIGIAWGCRWFGRKLHTAQGDTHRALLYWNGGGNPHYPDEVIALSEAFK